jgi:hypothetical protein
MNIRYLFVHRHLFLFLFFSDTVWETALISIADFGSLFLGCTTKPKLLRKAFLPALLLDSLTNAFLLCSDRQANTVRQQNTSTAEQIESQDLFGTKLINHVATQSSG